MSTSPSRHSERLDALVTAAVVDDRPRKARHAREHYGLGHLGRVVCRRDEIDVSRPLPRKREHYLGEPPRGHDPARRGVRYLVVLAEYALEVAAREEYRPRALLPHEDALLAEVEPVTTPPSPAPRCRSTPPPPPAASPRTRADTAGMGSAAPSDCQWRIRPRIPAFTSGQSLPILKI